MPPRRRTALKEPSDKRTRQSKLAKENNISAGEEAEIKEVFGLFAEPMDGEKEGIIPSDDVRRAMIALGIPPSPTELQEFTSILDPDGEGFATYSSFVAICALKMRMRDEDVDGETHAQEVDEAFQLFTQEREAATITLAHLKRVAAMLKEEVDEGVLKDMILEANGGKGVGRGVRRDEFDRVMERAGVWRS